jgi:hypothetical protein
MVNIFPQSYPKETDPLESKYKVFQVFRDLSDQLSVIYSKQFKGCKNSKEETQIDFLIFDGHKNFICLEVNGLEIINCDMVALEYFLTGQPVNIKYTRNSIQEAIFIN